MDFNSSDLPKSTSGDPVNLDASSQKVRESEAMAKRYAQAEQALDEFLSTLMHDIRSPLCSLKTALDLGEEYIKDADYVSLKDMLRSSNESTQRLLDFVDRLYANVRVGHSTLELQNLNLNKTIRDLSQDLFSQFNTSGAKLSFRETLPTVLADQILARQLFQNLILNAIKFRAPQRPMEIEISVGEQSENSVEIVVSDNGVGFPSERAESLFDRYYKSRQRYNEGMGLGLATCKLIVDKHGWEIRAESEEGEGARFIVCMQLADGV